MFKHFKFIFVKLFGHVFYDNFIISYNAAYYLKKGVDITNYNYLFYM
jgi:hypothetical protein